PPPRSSWFLRESFRVACGRPPARWPESPRCAYFSLAKRSGLELDDGPLRLILVLCAGGRNLCRSQIELCLAQLDDRAQAQIVPALSQIQCKLCLFQQLIGQAHTLERRHRSEVGDA